jgi:hypothetical protein
MRKNRNRAQYWRRVHRMNPPPLPWRGIVALCIQWMADQRTECKRSYGAEDTFHRMRDTARYLRHADPWFKTQLPE